MNQKLSPSTILLLTVSPVMWAGNAIVGRAVHELVPPVLLIFLRWGLALAVLLPFACGVCRRDSLLWPAWGRFALLGLIGVGRSNTLQYLALQTSPPITVTLVAASMPNWM